ncbi:aquaporin Z/aquaporin NIP [Pseudonocardia sediminis]|uniref:Aquaporin Z/aquaporin NIP n=1 Tax=Pseudonocardia sediminis TaxID=1397368 RepID=A0A4Q7UVV6_PSEST|nr:aquaporin [Pseudonocardia sediminis]RZT84209.1 aquaporin Z/aquaporin NIP [Pseudonocardia sediminis]
MTEQAKAGLYGSSLGANMLTSGVAELLGTFVLVYGGTAVATAASLARPVAGVPYDSLATPLVFGFALLVVVAAIGHVSGGHVNPAVTLGLAATGRFPWRFVPAYLVAQLGGALLGALATWATFGNPGRADAALGATAFAPATGIGQALLVEALVTFLLVFVVVSVATDERVPSALAPLAVGFALTVSVMIAGPVTGGAVNPVRALGPMIVSGNPANFWVYVVGPIAGGLVAALVYDRFLARGATPQ